MATCRRPDCTLTALWKVGVKFIPRWDADLHGVMGWTDLVMCGLHDEVTVEDIGASVDVIADRLTGGHGDALRKEVVLSDISDSSWGKPG